VKEYLRGLAEREGVIKSTLISPNPLGVEIPEKGKV
jgi:hypothetical protein